MLIPLLSACDPKEPTNELLNKRHDNPSYVIFTLKEAKLNDPTRWDAEPTLADITLTGREEKMTLSLTNKGFLASEEQGVSQFSVKSTDTESDVVYLLEIDYLDARRERADWKFLLTIMLMHAHQPKIYNGQAMPFYNNLYYPIDQESDISLNVTFVVDAGTTDLTGREEASSN